MGKHRKNTRIKHWGLSRASSPLAPAAVEPSVVPLIRRGPAPQTLERLAARGEEFFAPLGAVVELTTDDVLVDGEPIYRPGLDTSSIIDTIGVERYSDRLTYAATSEILTRIADTRTEIRGGSLHVYRGHEPWLSIRPTHALVDGAPGPQILGNFMLAGGPHWQELRARAGAASDVIVLTQLPECASAEQRARALAASASIRTCRRRSFERAIVTIMSRSTGGRHIVFSPTPSRGPVAAPFTFTDGGQTITAALRLGGSDVGILPLATAWHPTNDDQLITAWLYSLESFEYLTCAPEREEASERPPQPEAVHRPVDESVTAGTEPQSGKRGLRSLRSAQPRNHSAATSRLPIGLEPDASTLHDLPLYVADYSRRLPDGQQQGDDARARAGRAGITLNSQETWVTGYWRGSGQLATLQFTWTEPHVSSQEDQRAA